jgi:hypothetical protein
MTTVKPFDSNTLPTFQYEPFSYVIYNTKTPLTKTTETTGILEGYLTIDASAVIFRSTNNLMAAGTQSFTITDASSNVSSNIVTIGAGRFRDASSNSISGSNYVFYKGESITPITIYAPFVTSLPTASPILPPGLAFFDMSGGVYNISGTPTVTVPQSNHLFLARGLTSNLGKIITSTNVGMIVSNERILFDVSGSPIVSGMTVGTSIGTRAITARFPPYTTNGKSFRYTWSGLPSGISVKDICGTVRTSPFDASDSAYTLILEGAPTLAAAQAFAQAGITSNVVTFTGTRISPTPLVTNNVSFTFAFAPTVLFTSNVIQSNFYKNVPVDSSANYFTAQTFFDPSASPITSITAASLPTGLSLSSLVAGRVNLTGTPTTDVSSTYTLIASNASAVSRSLDVSINVITDTIRFSNRTDTSYSFIEGRPLSNALTNYYPFPIEFTASADSGSPVTFSTTDLVTGYDLSYSSPNSVKLVGSSTIETPRRNLSVVATATVTGESNNQDVSYAVLNDDIIFTPVPASNLSFVQNRTIAPIQLTASALSQRAIVAYTASNLPAGLRLSTTGSISGTPSARDGTNFTITAFTSAGTTGFIDLSCTITPDSVLLLTSPLTYTYSPGANVVIDITGVAYSGKTVSNYTFSNFTPSYGLSIDSNSGMITGMLPDGLPPNSLLPSDCNFSVNAVAGTLDASLGCTLTTVNNIVNRSFLFDNNAAGGVSQLFINDTGGLSLWETESNFTWGQTWITDFQIKNTTVDSNTFLMCDSGGNGSNSTVIRSTNGVNFTTIPFGGNSSNRAYKSLNLSNTSTWYIAGTTERPSNGVAFYTSSDDGLTWNVTSELPMASRQNVDITNYYTYQGVALGYSNSIFMIGGGYNASNFPDAAVMRRSTDAGSNWSTVEGAFAIEVGNFSMDGPVWVATGSGRYSSGTDYSGSFDDATPTLKWSDDQGLNWNDASGTVCDFAGYEVAYVSNTWLSTGMDRDGSTTTIVSKLLCSTDGKVWSNVTLDGALSFNAFSNTHLPEVGSLWFDGSNWNVLVKLDGGGDTCSIYSHGLSTPLTTGWTLRVPAVEPFDGTSGPQLRGFWQQYVRTGFGITLSTFRFASFPTGGPVIVSPTTTSFTFYQYVTIDPITISATGTGFIYYFVDNSTLPVGLAFDPLTGRITGQSVEIGQKSFTIYMKDDIGATFLTINTNTIIPRVIRQQTGAGAWTSLVRQYTVVNAAQNSVNGHVLPATEATLGEFTRPEPPDSVTASNCPKC